MKSKHVGVWTACVAVIALVSCSVASSAVTIVVEEDDLQPPGSASGWCLAMQSSSAGPPVGQFWNAMPQGERPPETTSGAFHFLTELRTGSDPLQKIYLGTNNHSGVALNDITSFKYYTYLRSRRYDGQGGDPDGQPPIIEIITDSGSNTYQQRIFVYRPWGWWGGHNVQKNTWQEWDLMDPNNTRAWQMLQTGSTNCWGNWDWVKSRYPGTMTFQTPVVGDYTQGYDAAWRLANQSGTSISIRVGSGRAVESKIWNPDTQSWKYPWSWWRESCAIDAYADRLVIGINGVETVYDFGGDAPTVGIRPGSCRDPIIAPARRNYFYVVFGRVMDGPTPSEFFLDDGDKKIRVVTQNSVAAGEFWRAKGVLVWNSDTNRYDLYSSVYDLHPLYIPGP